MSGRPVDWPTALRDMESDRAPRREVREERLRSTAGLRGTPALALSAWRGRSGRRYVVGVYDLIEPTDEEFGEAVVIAVARNKDGIAHPVSITSIGQGPGERLRRSWLSDARRRGASEVHLHRLAETAGERAAIVADLEAERL